MCMCTQNQTELEHEKMPILKIKFWIDQYDYLGALELYIVVRSMFSSIIARVFIVYGKKNFLEISLLSL